MSMNIALTGLAAATTDLSVTSDNIANANTTGFKSSRAEFGDLVNSLSAESSGMGVRLLATTQNFSQGTIATTGKSLDLAISGDGFFQVATNDGTAYTRAGAFSLTKGKGLNPLDPADTGTGYSYISNTQSQYLKGYGLTVSDPIATTEVKFDDLILNSSANPPAATFNPSEKSSYNYSTSLTLYDSEGVNHNLRTYFRNLDSTTTPGGATVSSVTTPVYWNIYSILDGITSPSGQVLPVSGGTGTSATPNGTPTITLVFDDGASSTPVGYITYDSTGAGTYTAATDISINNVFDLGRNATLSPNMRFSATQLGDTFINGIGTVADGSDASQTIAGDPNELLKIDLSSMSPKKTDTVSASANLASVQPRTEASTLLKYDILMENKQGLSSSPSANFSTSTLIYDGKGNAHTLKTVFESCTTTDPTDNPPSSDTNTWLITYYLLDSNGNQRGSYDGGVWTFKDVDVPDFVGSYAFNSTHTTRAFLDVAGGATEINSISFTSDELGTGAPGFVTSVDLDDIKIISPASDSARSSINRILATSLTADPAPINGQPPSMDPTIPANYNFTTATTVYDSLGNSHTMNIYFRKIADNNWTIYTQFPDVSTLADKIGSLTFDSKGNLLTVRDAFGYINPDPAKVDLINILDVRFPNGSTPQNIALDVAKITQFDSKSITNSITQNGYKDGILTSVTSDALGNIIAKYDNDQSQTMGQIALAKFNDTQGLKRIGDNNWVQTSESGEPVFRSPGFGVGKLVTSALESSNVDLTQQLVNMITAQRNFQANAQVITTNSTLYQSILGAAR